MSDIKSCIVTIAPYSKARNGKKRLSRKDAVRALLDGTDLRIFNVNGMPCDSYCSVRDMAVGCSVELREGDDCIAAFHLTAADKAITSPKSTIDPQENDIPVFANGYSIELD